MEKKTKTMVGLIIIVAIVAVVIVPQLIIWISMSRSYARETGFGTVAEATNLTFFGTGNTTTEKFPLEKGQVWLGIKTHGENRHHCSIKLINIEEDKIMFITNVDAVEPGSSSGSIRDIEKQGDYRLEIKADCRWTIIIEQPVPENPQYELIEAPQQKLMDLLSTPPSNSTRTY